MSMNERLYRIDQMLTDRKFVTSAEMQERLEISRATLMRDLAYLRDRLNAPIIYDRELGGYRFGKQAELSGTRYELPGLWFSAEEIRALLAMQQLLANAGPGLLEQELAKLNSRLEKILRSGLPGYSEIRRIRILPMASRVPQGDSFRTIAGAVLQRRRLHISYRARGDDSTSQREISPQRLTHYRDNWYLDAFCHHRQALRCFAVDRISNVTVLDIPAENIPDATLDAHFADGYGIFAGEAKHTAILRFTPDRARWVADERWHPQQQGHFLDNGEYELHIPYADPRELVMDILRHVPEVEVIAPDELKRDVVKHLRLSLEKYTAQKVNT